MLHNYVVYILHLPCFSISMSPLTDVGWLPWFLQWTKLNVLPLYWRISTISICSCDSALFGTSPTAHGPNGTGARRRQTKWRWVAILGWCHIISWSNGVYDEMRIKIIPISAMTHLHHSLVGAFEHHLTVSPTLRGQPTSTQEKVWACLELTSNLHDFNHQMPAHHLCRPPRSLPKAPGLSKGTQGEEEWLLKPWEVNHNSLQHNQVCSLNMFEPLLNRCARASWILNMKCCEGVGRSGCKCFEMPILSPFGLPTSHVSCVSIPGLVVDLDPAFP